MHEKFKENENHCMRHAFFMSFPTIFGYLILYLIHPTHLRSLLVSRDKDELPFHIFSSAWWHVCVSICVAIEISMPFCLLPHRTSCSVVIFTSLHRECVYMSEILRKYVQELETENDGSRGGYLAAMMMMLGEYVMKLKPWWIGSKI